MMAASITHIITYIHLCYYNVFIELLVFQGQNHEHFTPKTQCLTTENLYHWSQENELGYGVISKAIQRQMLCGTRMRK